MDAPEGLEAVMSDELRNVTERLNKERVLARARMREQLIHAERIVKDGMNDIAGLIALDRVEEQMYNAADRAIAALILSLEQPKRGE